MKINFDGFLQNTSAVGGYIICDWKGTTIRVGSNYYGCTSITVAEARALRDGVQEAHAAGFKNLIIKGDNQVIINMLSSTGSAPWQISNIIKDVRYWLDQSNQVEVRHAYGETNMVVDWLSKYGHSN